MRREQHKPVMLDAGLASFSHTYLSCKSFPCGLKKCNTCVAIGMLLITFAIISHMKPVIGFESTTSLLRKLTRDLLFFRSCVIEDNILIFWVSF